MEVKQIHNKNNGNKRRLEFHVIHNKLFIYAYFAFEIV